MAPKRWKRPAQLVQGTYSRPSNRASKILTMCPLPPRLSEDELSDDDIDKEECSKDTDTDTDTSSCLSLGSNKSVWDEILHALEAECQPLGSTEPKLCEPEPERQANSDEPPQLQQTPTESTAIRTGSILALQLQQTPSGSTATSSSLILTPQLQQTPTESTAIRTGSILALQLQQTPSGSTATSSSLILTPQLQQTPSESTATSVGSILSSTSTPTLEHSRKVRSSRRRLILSESTPKTPKTSFKAKRPALSKSKKKKKKLDEKKSFFSFQSSTFDFPVNIQDDGFVELKSPIEYFYSFFSEELIKYIAEQTMLFSIQKHGRVVFSVTEADIKDFLAIKLLMGILKCPAYTDYWSEALRCPLIADIMSLKNYQFLRSHIHFNDNTQDDGDPYYKIRPVMESVRRNCVSLENETRQSIDEMMVPYKGTRAGSKRQYMKKKPKKWGYKLFTRCGVSGMVYDFLAYVGGGTFRGIHFTPYEEKLGLTGKVIVGLCKSIPSPALKVVYFDNWFCSLELLWYLRHSLGVLALGTINRNRMRGNTFPNEGRRKPDRGTSTQIADNEKKVVVVKWVDNREVYVASNFVDSHPIGTILRWDKTAREKKQIPCPKIIKEYNFHMGGVDLQDMLVALYRTNFRSKKWYLRMFAQMIDISVNNAWILYKRQYLTFHGEQLKMPLKDFRLQVARCLLAKGPLPNAVDIPSTRTILNPVLPRPPSEVAKDNVGHFPIFSTKGRCRNCPEGQTMVHCTKCKIRLCLTSKKNCFFNFHQ